MFIHNYSHKSCLLEEILVLREEEKKVGERGKGEVGGRKKAYTQTNNSIVSVKLFLVSFPNLPIGTISLVSGSFANVASKGFPRGLSRFTTNLSSVEQTPLKQNKFVSIIKNFNTKYN